MNFKKLLIFIMVFLVGCSVKTPVGPTHISSKAYFCRGAWHFPQNYYEYDEVGIASWYGDDFHGRKKASGEHFDKMALTAAHKTLPIPSVVRVTSLKTGKSVVVVVDDRGPFVYRGRIIDLSYGAAKALGIHKYKPSQVRVQTLVSDSLNLSRYIYYYCKKRKDPFGRTWSELYRQEIKGQRLKAYTAKAPVVRSEKTSKNKITKPQKRKYNSLGSYLNRI